MSDSVASPSEIVTEILTMSDPVNFPPEIITEILSRLPVKPLLRFRCVSKPWCSLIDSKEFVKMHLKKSVATKTNLNLVLGFQKRYCSISLDSVHPTGSVSIDSVEHLAPVPFSDTVMSSTCNGLSLVVISHQPKASQLFIWNPFTRKYREIPVTPIKCPVKLGHLLKSLIPRERYAFAYVSETDEYKIVRVTDFSLFDGSWWSWMGSKAKMFSSISNKWETIEDFPYRLSCIRGWGAHLNGVLHTVVNTGPLAWSIMRFDVKSKQHAVVPSPDFGVRIMSHLCVDVLGESLSITHQNRDQSTIDVWVMKHYGVEDSWVKLVSVATPGRAFAYGTDAYSGSLQPLAYSKDGEEVLLNVIDKRLYWYNLRTGTEREVTVNMASEFYTELCFESLVSFPGFICVGNRKDKSEGNLKNESKVKKSYTTRDFFFPKDFRLRL